MAGLEKPDPPLFYDLLDEKFGRVWDRFDSIDKALVKADSDLTAYKLTANEFRGTLSDQAGRLATKEELKQKDALIEIQRQRIDKIENTAANLQGRIWMLAAIFAGLQVLVNLAQRYLPQSVP